MSDKKPIVIKAKGRPMLNWVGKKPIDIVKSYPAQVMEVVNFSGKNSQIESLHYEELEKNWSNLLFHGDNKEVLAFLLENGYRGKIDLIYIDPPFDSNADYIRKVELRGKKEKVKLSGEEYTIGEQIQYNDIWANDNYLQFMYERFLLLNELLAPHGNILVQMDHHRVHYIKCIMDEVFDEQNFVNEIIWYKGREGGSSRSHKTSSAIPTEYQSILLYAKNRDSRYWNPPLGPYKLDTIKNIEKDEKGWYYTRGRMGRTPAPWEIEQGSGLKTYVHNDPNLTKEEVISILTDPDAKYVEIGDVWNNNLIKLTRETDYPTEKPKSLLELIIQAGSKVDSKECHLVLDCFIGSGTTCAVAQKLGRRWIGIDINKGSIQTTSGRLQNIIREQSKQDTETKTQTKLMQDDPTKRYLSFATLKVNDYDLQLLKTEAIELAIQHTGVQRIKTDTFFEGTRGNNLVKIIDFNHPLSLLDLSLIQEQMEIRRDEERDITIICLGKEIAVDPWIEDYNRRHQINKINVIELRGDKKYGKFFVHEPPSAKVEIQRKENKVNIEISDFISPSIIERLNSSESLIKAKTPDFRSMIDSVLIDTDYDGKVFNVAKSDIPKNNSELVKAKYEVPLTKDKVTVAVKITDMLGEEIIIHKEI